MAGRSGSLGYLEDGLPVDVSGSDHFHLYAMNAHLEGVPQPDP